MWGLGPFLLVDLILLILDGYNKRRGRGGGKGVPHRIAHHSSMSFSVTEREREREDFPCSRSLSLSEVASS